MGLKDSVLAERRNHGETCSFVGIYASLSKADAKDLREMLGDLAFTAAQIHRGLQSIGHKVAPTTVRRHRAMECACGAR